jgi:hypothetical protein
MRILFLFFLLLPLWTFGQTVKNIKTTQLDSKIKIEFNIENSTEDQLLSISVHCLVNDEFKINLKSAEGDLGYNVCRQTKMNF